MSSRVVVVVEVAAGPFGQAATTAVHGLRVVDVTVGGVVGGTVVTLTTGG